MIFCKIFMVFDFSGDFPWINALDQHLSNQCSHTLMPALKHPDLVGCLQPK